MDAAQTVLYLRAAAGLGEKTRKSGTLKMRDALRGRSFAVLMGIAFIASANKGVQELQHAKKIQCGAE
ncbi:hypothetical protein RGV33_19260 [Pseudomonas sp. Bout1]|uniref:hypothetical protein n=1 Tax=Pseudomonas sp. Bout1 TaxID=3048600 RepID=UPI002AB53848|nr:hypothetical protein [Pseudomonas sp. Bout1]MDY7533800.1 hypothetical protein [Pseudomonas sp. Bout1]MEB0186820.1 hypothetical protein [Pseudomonas sp. Bout1]